jgi:quinol monooxygenase YgiN
MRAVVLAEPGCLAWEALHSTSDPRRVVLVEQWESREAWEAHDGLSGIQEIYVPHVLPFVTREIHVSDRLGQIEVLGP